MSEKLILKPIDVNSLPKAGWLIYDKHGNSITSTPKPSYDAAWRFYFEIWKGSFQSYSEFKNAARNQGKYASQYPMPEGELV